MDTSIYEKGISFKCQGSANCCVSRGKHGYVFLSKKDLKRLTNYFNHTLEEFKKKFCQTTDGYLHIKEVRNNGDCYFLENKRCSIYKARPTQCRTWPFWPENMKTKIWNNEVLNFCPGIGKGKTINKNKIELLIIEDRKNSKNIYKE